MKEYITSPKFYVGMATAVALWYLWSYMRARKTASQTS